MVVQFQLTEADLREATAALVEVAARKSASRPKYGLTIASLALGYGLFQIGLYAGIPFEQNFASLMVPSVFLIMLGLGTSTIGKLRLRRRPSLRSLINSVLLLSSLGLYFLLRHLAALIPTRPPAPPFNWTLLMPHAMWVGILTIATISNFRKQKVRVKKAWESNRSFHRPKTSEITAFSVTYCDPVQRSEYQWDAFTKFEETRNLFVLILGGVSTIILPKRAFSSQEEMNALRELAKQIDARTPSGFPVGPTTPPVPTSEPPPLSTGAAPLPLPPRVN